MWGELVVLTTITTICVSILYVFGAKHNNREPSAVTHLIPYVGHLLGLVWWGQHYFERIR